MTNSSGPSGLIKVAIIGAGFMATEHAKAFASIANVKVCGVYNRTTVKAQTLASTYQIPIVASSIQELYQQTKADIVVIAVYETIARQIITEAAQFPWVILAEKPAGLNLQETVLIHQSFGHHPIFIATNRRHYSSTIAALEDLSARDGERFIRVTDAQSTALARSIGHHKDVCKYWMYANSVHLIDYFTLFCRGELENVNVVSEYIADQPCTVIAYLKFTSGDKGLYCGFWNGKMGGWSVEINHNDVRWKMDPLEKAFFVPQNERSWYPVEKSKADIEFKAGLLLQAHGIINYVASGIQPQSPTLSQMLKTVTMINKIFKI